jgi:DNA-binding protein Fis
MNGPPIALRLVAASLQTDSHHGFRSVNGHMKRVIVQILPTDTRSTEHGVDSSVELASEPAVISINAGSRSSVAKDREDDAGGVRLEAVVSAERARTVVDTLLNVNELTNINSFDRLVDLLIQRELANDESGQLFHRVMSSVEKALVEKAYVECGQVQTRTAERLGVNRNTIHKKLLKHELLDPEEDELDTRPDVVLEKRKCV